MICREKKAYQCQKTDEVIRISYVSMHCR